jgi:hypothetical protein
MGPQPPELLYLGERHEKESDEMREIREMEEERE